MSVKLMALDVDGTLTDGEGNISPENANAVRAATAKGIKVVLATGRPLQGVEAICSELGIHGPHILVNGSVIMLGEEVWAENCFSADELRAAYQHGEQLGGISVMAFQPDIVWLWIPDSMDKDWISDRMDSFQLYKRTEVASLRELPLEQVNKVMYMGNEQSIDRVFETWPEEISHLATGRSYTYVGEINPPKANKGAALAFVAEKLGLQPEEVLAMGDGETDLPMLRFAGTSVFIPRGCEVPKMPGRFAVVPKEECDRGVAWGASKYLSIPY
ncbi:Cof-type HAD-IIB family hydrolase [Caproiciproducens faecalis]|uniref:HAD family phosphatase n=1 Tax=Caproiciproducens faecalis TaxID=2820301 RepID=A0ABS7DLP6_9FIRM|nr:Cof-type HAD-IIB family hydrolase [Caproiciproducens faecalis]MBW7572016.1 HAD family phosphatase [Caproiciproducens faecalis]